jgi:hypothetical protein
MPLTTEAAVPDPSQIVARIIGGCIAVVIVGAMFTSFWNGVLAAAGAR